MAKKLIFLLLFTVVFSAALIAQETPPTPEPYTHNEFPEWMHDLRRGEVLAVGTFPYAYLITNIAYPWFVYAVTGLDEVYHPFNLNDDVYAGLDLKYGTGTQEFENKIKKERILIATAVISIGVAIIDYVIRKSDKKRR